MFSFVFVLNEPEEASRCLCITLSWDLSVQMFPSILVVGFIAYLEGRGREMDVYIMSLCEKVFWLPTLLYGGNPLFVPEVDWGCCGKKFGIGPTCMVFCKLGRLRLSSLSFFLTQDKGAGN